MTKSIVPEENRANLAQLLESNPIWQQALNDLEEDFTQALKNTAPACVTQRENCYYMIRAIDELRKQVQALKHSSTGRAAKGAIDRAVNPQK